MNAVVEEIETQESSLFGMHSVVMCLHSLPG